MLSQNTPDSNTIIFHRREYSGSKVKEPRTRWRGGELLLWGTVCFSNDENVLESNSGNGCPTL